MAIDVHYIKFQFKVPPQITEGKYKVAKLQLHNMNQTYDPKPILKFNDTHRRTYKLLYYTVGLLCISIIIAVVLQIPSLKTSEIISIIIGLLLLFLSFALIAQLFSLKTSYQSFRVYKRQHKNFYQFVQRMIRESNSYDEYLHLYRTEGKKVWI